MISKKLGALCIAAMLPGLSPARVLEFQTTQTTGASVVISPDGNTLVFTMLGHLFSVPAGGGTASQLTFGPYYDDSPCFSPDGSRLSFLSDRDAGDENVFVLNLKSHQIIQVTHETLPSQQVWSPDGKSIVYLRRAGPNLRDTRVLPVRIPADGGEPSILNSLPRRMGEPFYLSNGQLAWSVIETASGVTRLETVDAQGATSTLKTIPGVIARVLAGPRGDGYICHRLPGPADDSGVEAIVFVPSGDKPERRIAPVTRAGQFALAPDGRSLYFGDEGHLWRIDLPAGGRQNVAFRANVKLEVQEISKPEPTRTLDTDTVTAILNPQLSPDGRTLIFGAAGFLWRQQLDGSKAQRIATEDAFEAEAAFSPDGRTLAYVRTLYGQDSLCLLDLATSRKRVLAKAPFIQQLSWSSDGKRLLGVLTAILTQTMVSFDVADGKTELLPGATSWSPRPQFSADGRAIFYSTDKTGTGNLVRVALGEGAKPEQITHLTRHLSDARLSADGKWLVFRRNHSILVASLSKKPIEDSEVREFAEEGGDSFSLSGDGSAVVYSVGRQVWRKRLAGGPAEQIPIHLDMQRAVASPLFVRGVRILDLDKGSFGAPTDILIQGGRIQRIGGTPQPQLPPRTVILDGTGHFAIPGLFDSHAHAQGANTEAFLAYGVTSVRDPGDSLAEMNVLQDRSNLTGLPLPRYFFSGEIFEGNYPVWGDEFLQITTEEEARAYVRKMKRYRATFIKVYPSLSWPLKRVVVEEAHRLGLPVVGHGKSPEEIVKSINLGFFSLEHNLGPSREFDDLLQMFAAAGTRWDPTIAVATGDVLLLRDEPERQDEKFRAFTPPVYMDLARSAFNSRNAPTGELRSSVAAELASIAAANRAGVKLLIGTDAPNPSVFYGSSLHWELERFVEAGLSPLDAIRIATHGAAEAVGAAELGSIQENKLADLVLLDGDPLVDIRNAEKIWRVVKDGWIFDPRELAPSH